LTVGFNALRLRIHR